MLSSHTIINFFYKLESSSSSSSSLTCFFFFRRLEVLTSDPLPRDFIFNFNFTEDEVVSASDTSSSPKIFKQIYITSLFVKKKNIQIIYF